MESKVTVVGAGLVGSLLDSFQVLLSRSLDAVHLKQRNSNSHRDVTSLPVSAEIDSGRNKGDRAGIPRLPGAPTRSYGDHDFEGEP